MVALNVFYIKQQKLLNYINPYAPPYLVDEQILEDIGLTKNQVKIYLALSDAGPTRITSLAKAAGLHRINTYEAVNKLIKLGLVAASTRDNVKYLQTTEPSNLLNMLQQKEERVKRLIPELQLRFAMQQSEGTEAKVFYGVKAFQQALDNFLLQSDEILVFGIPKVAPEKMKYFIENYHKRRIDAHITMKHIYNFQAFERVKYLNTMPYCQARYLPTQFDSTVSTNICGSTVVFVGWNEPIWVVQITNKDIADSYKKYFYLLWESSEKSP